jgi:hypothetical protein
MNNHTNNTYQKHYSALYDQLFQSFVLDVSSTSKDAFVQIIDVDTNDSTIESIKNNSNPNSQYDNGIPSLCVETSYKLVSVALGWVV